MVKCKYWAVVCPFLLLFIPDVHSIDWNTAYTPEGKFDLENVLPYKKSCFKNRYITLVIFHVCSYNFL